MRILSIDSAFGRALTLLADVALVSLCLTLTAVAVVPLGAGLAAGNFVVHQLVREEGSRPWRTFWRAFRASFTRATVGWLVWLALIGAGIYELWLLNNAEVLGITAGDGNGIIAGALRVGIISAFILLGMITTWFFPIVGEVAMKEAAVKERGAQEQLSPHAATVSPTPFASAHAQVASVRPPATFLSLLRLSAVAALRFAPVSGLALALWCAPVVLGIFNPQVGASLVFFYIVFIPAFTLYLIALVADSQLRQLVPSRGKKHASTAASDWK